MPKITAKSPIVETDDIREMLQAPGWRAFHAAALKMREELVEDLIHGGTEVATATQRGRIQALDEILRLPGVLIDELQAKRGKKEE
jgi:hypothetical protein